MIPHKSEKRVVWQTDPIYRMDPPPERRGWSEAFRRFWGCVIRTCGPQRVLRAKINPTNGMPNPFELWHGGNRVLTNFKVFWKFDLIKSYFFPKFLFKKLIKWVWGKIAPSRISNSRRVRLFFHWPFKTLASILPCWPMTARNHFERGPFFKNFRPLDLPLCYNSWKKPVMVMDYGLESDVAHWGGSQTHTYNEKRHPICFVRRKKKVDIPRTDVQNLWNVLRAPNDVPKMAIKYRCVVAPPHSHFFLLVLVG